MNKTGYLRNYRKDVQRLLTNMDRNRDSATFGCLCRPYWHDKTVDFPSAHQQIGVLPLSLMYGNKFEDNPYYKDDNIQELCVAGIKYWEKIQRENGSFDEHYPREHSLGATAWSLWAVTEALPHLDVSPEISNAVKNAVEFISDHDEPGNIANHQAVTASALFNASYIVDVPDKLIQERIRKVEKMQSEEGWFQEYRGGDPGYQSTALSHLARIWLKRPELVDENMLKNGIRFFSKFIDKENYYGSRIGSRRTQHVHPTGFEILAEEFEEAAKISKHLRNHSMNDRILDPSSVDDKHFSWHLAEFLDSYLHCSPVDPEEIELESCQLKDFYIECQERDKVFVNLTKGGYLKHYRDGKLVNLDSGITTKFKEGVFTSNWSGTTENQNITDGEIKLKGKLRKVPENNLKWPKSALLKLFQHTIGRYPQVSLFVKNFMIKKLITGKNSKYEFQRTIDLENKEVENVVEGEKVQGKTRSMFIPNSEYYER